MFIYARINQLDGVKNRNVELVLHYIAVQNQLIDGKNIERKKIYKKIIEPKLKTAAEELNIMSFHGSRRQFRKVCMHKKGRFPIHISVYLYVLYLVIRDQIEDIAFENSEDDIEYTAYMIGILRNKIHDILMYGICGHLDQVEHEALHVAYNEMMDLDNATKRNERKVYNNIW